MLVLWYLISPSILFSLLSKKAFLLTKCWSSIIEKWYVFYLISKKEQPPALFSLTRNTNCDTIKLRLGNRIGLRGAPTCISHCLNGSVLGNISRSSSSNFDILVGTVSLSDTTSSCSSGRLDLMQLQFSVMPEIGDNLA